MGGLGHHFGGSGHRFGTLLGVWAGSCSQMRPGRHFGRLLGVTGFGQSPAWGGCMHACFGIMTLCCGIFHEQSLVFTTKNVWFSPRKMFGFHHGKRRNSFCESATWLSTRAAMLGAAQLGLESLIPAIFKMQSIGFVHFRKPLPASSTTGSTTSNMLASLMLLLGVRLSRT